VATNGSAIAGVTVYVDLDQSGSLSAGDPSTLTDANGDYSINNIPAGPQTIRQMLPAGDTQTSPTGNQGLSVAVPAGGSLSSENFIDALPAPTTGTISGLVTTSSGGGIAGLTIYLDSNNNSKLDTGELSTTTSSTGAYSFSSVPAGATIVRQILPTGTTQTTPSDNYGIHLTVTAGGSLTGEHFVDALVKYTAAPATAATAGTSKAFALGSFTQSGATGPFSVDVHWGDGTADTKFTQTSAGILTAESHTFTKAGVDTVSVTITDAKGDQSNVGSFNVTVSPGAASKLAIVQQPTAGTHGAAASPVFIVDVDDSLGNIVTSDSSSVTLSESSGPAGGFAQAVLKTIDGVAKFGALVFSKAGTYVVKATDGKLATAASKNIVIK